MVTERVTDGKRIAQLLASELRGRTDGPLGRVSVADVHDVEGSLDGEFAYRIVVEAGDVEDEPGGSGDGDGDGDDPRPLADVYVHETRARLAVRRWPEATARAGERAGLRVRPIPGDPPRTLLFVESGVEAKRAADAVVDLLAGAVDPGSRPTEDHPGPDGEENR